MLIDNMLALLKINETTGIKIEFYIFSSLPVRPKPPWLYKDDELSNPSAK